MISVLLHLPFKGSNFQNQLVTVVVNLDSIWSKNKLSNVYGVNCRGDQTMTKLTLCSCWLLWHDTCILCTLGDKWHPRWSWGCHSFSEDAQNPCVPQLQGSTIVLLYQDIHEQNMKAMFTVLLPVSFNVKILNKVNNLCCPTVCSPHYVRSSAVV